MSAKTISSTLVTARCRRLPRKRKTYYFVYAVYQMHRDCGLISLALTTIMGDIERLVILLCRVFSFFDRSDAIGYRLIYTYSWSWHWAREGLRVVELGVLARGLSGCQKRGLRFSHTSDYITTWRVGDSVPCI